MSIRHTDPVPSTACRTCGGHGHLWDYDFECSKVKIPCPSCAPTEARARLAHEFGTDKQREAIARRSRAISMRPPR